MRTLKLQAIVRRFVEDESGSNALEYGLIVGLISLAIAAGATAAGQSLSTMFNTISARIAADVATFAPANTN
jgi:pilus assembly protein Flp/PilA